MDDQLTKNSLKRSEMNDGTTKRMKIDEHINCNPNYRLTRNKINFDVDNILQDRVNKKNPPLSLDTIVYDEDIPIMNTVTSKLETMPNELLFHIFSYMSQIDIVSTLFGLNLRFNSLVLECIRHLKIPEKTDSSWFMKYLTCIQNGIEVISLDISSISYVFSCIHSYRNLQCVILNDRYNFIIKLNIKHHHVFDTIVSCLNLLKNCGTLTKNDFTCSTFLNIRKLTLPTNERIRTRSKKPNMNSLSCPAIEYLSIRDLSMSGAISLCKHAPNLMHLQIVRSRSIRDNLCHTSKKNFFPKMNSITNLHIEMFNRGIDFNSIKRLINCCRLSLQSITLIAYGIDGFNGQTLEKLFQTCNKLKKLSFHIEYHDHADIDMTEQLHKFQSAWWLDNRRPPVFVYRDNDNYRVIASMPCSSSLCSLTLSTNLNTWPLNKGHFDSTQIYFSRVTSIYFDNSNQEPVLVDFLYLFNGVFRSHVEYLEFKYWGFKDPRTLYKLLINPTVMAPCLPSIKHLKTSSANWDGLDGMTLIIWLLLTPNVRELYLPTTNNAQKLKLGEELNVLFTTEPRLRTISERIERVAINWSFDSNDDQTKPEVFNLFAEMFPKAIISNI